MLRRSTWLFDEPCHFRRIRPTHWPRRMERRLGAHRTNWGGDPERPARISLQRMDSEIGLHPSSRIRFRLHEFEPYWIGQLVVGEISFLHWFQIDCRNAESRALVLRGSKGTFR